MGRKSAGEDGARLDELFEMVEGIDELGVNGVLG